MIRRAFAILVLAMLTLSSGTASATFWGSWGQVLRELTGLGRGVRTASTAELLRGLESAGRRIEGVAASRIEGSMAARAVTHGAKTATRGDDLLVLQGGAAPGRILHLPQPSEWMTKLPATARSEMLLLKAAAAGERRSHNLRARLEALVGRDNAAAVLEQRQQQLWRQGPLQGRHGRPFISYPRGRTEIAARVRDVLRQHGFDPYLYLEPGARSPTEAWDTTLDALHESSDVVVILSGDSASSRFQMEEIRHALEAGKIRGVLLTVLAPDPDSDDWLQSSVSLTA